MDSTHAVVYYTERQKMGAVYWHEEGKASKPTVPIGRPGNVLGLTDAL